MWRTLKTRRFGRSLPRVALLGDRVRYVPPEAPKRPDYIGLLKKFNRKAAKKE